jgi:hypothetical protein
MDEHPDRATRAARNQSLFREVNERIEELNKAFDDYAPYGSWACECARMDCVERIDMTLGEYEAIRAAPNRFAILPHEDHFVPGVERVVERTERYWAVEKIGLGAAVAGELDPRSAERL